MTTAADWQPAHIIVGVIMPSGLLLVYDKRKRFASERGPLPSAQNRLHQNDDALTGASPRAVMSIAGAGAATSLRFGQMGTDIKRRICHDAAIGIISLLIPG